ncbi:PREDICTED: unconventional myosin-Va-like isoform X9 [Branchiostoma belcheri]|uniref:Unconventional myosin-Va-like isoform X9 n=1 Tax=Branchiostoma belcheri TaxID=7741 RepID=A0A6P4Y0F5_BRABE|nr:PREDICTED: unconventional myosin-Va-like isoform X9 [Branchiostoma belcheri]
MTTAELYTKGAQVWVPHPELVWQGAELTKDYKPGDKEMHLETEEERETIVKKMKSDEDLPPLRNPDILVGQNDLTSLSYLHEPAVLYNLQVRFLQNNAIYTYCGIVLVAINPYEQLPLYGNEMVMAYTGQDMGAMDPHIYAVAEEAFRQMQRDERNQSIIVSGESGAGKTVSAKYAMRYFATVGGSSDDMEASIEQRVLASNPIMETNWSQFLSVGEYTAETAIERKVLASNPVMEAIGNAKTIRNDNSSRFGKYIQIGFNKNYTIIGANMRTYLLEKSRIVFQAENERTYHIFYQLCAAADLPEFEDFCLSDPMNFNYTNQGGDPVIKDLDDLEEFHNTKQAMSLLGFSDKIQQEIFRILAALLHLGNIEVDENFKDSEKCYIDPENPHLYAVAELLGVDMNQFRKWMCNRKITAVHQVIEKPLRSSEAMHGRDALAKFLYGQLFDWIVSKINTVLTPQAKENSFIGVLDIYGFEVFEVNSFEQFCINYANEKLQQQFTQHVFKLEQEEYVREEITWSFIDYYDNQPCIDLIEAKLGLLDLLDEECKLPKGSDQNWCQKLYDKHLKKAKHFDKPRMSNSAFIIYHFADKVEYQAEGFLEKNRDLVNEEHINILRASEKFQLVADLVSTKGGLPAPPPAKKGKITMKHLPQKHKQPSKEMRKTVGLQFKESLCLLMETLNSTTPHYVRCIKPNDEKRAFTFEPKRAMQQLRACGVLETIRISSAGYPSRWTYPEFFQRYRVLMVSTEINREDMKNTCATVVSRLIKDPDKFQFGKTKIFFRAGQVAYMEKLRSDKLRACSIMIQKHIRGWLMKRRYQKLKQLALWLQQRTRGILARRYLKWMRETKAATTIQKRFRGYLARSRYLKMRWTILRIQAWGRGKFARIRFLQLRYEVKARLIQRAWRGYVARKRYWHEMQSIILIQSCWRRWLAKKELKKLKIQAKSVDHYKKLNKGMENKIIDLQRKLNEQNKESKELHKKVEVIQDLQTQVTELKKTEEVAKVSSNKVHELEDEITKLKAELDLTKKEKQMLEEEGEIYKEEQEMLNTALKAEIDRLATENKELMEKVALQEEEFQAAHVPELELEKQELEEELAQERSQHQQLIKDYARMEQRYENLRDEMTLLQQGKVGDMDSAVPSPRMHRRAGSDVSSVDLNSESGYGTIGKGEGEEQDSPKAPPRVKSLKKHAQELEGENQRLKVMVEALDEEKARMETMLEAETGSEVGILVGLQKKLEALQRENQKLAALAEGKELPKDKDEENQAEVMARLQKRLEEVESERKKLEDLLEEKEKEVKEQQADLVDTEEEKEKKRLHLLNLQNHVTKLEQENKDLQEALDVAKMKRFDIANLPEEMSDLVEENKKLKNDISNLRQAVADSNTEEELVKQLDVLTEELMVRREEVLTLKTSMVDQNIENSDQWDKETMTDLDLYLYPPEYLESLNEDGELMQAYLTQKETNRLLEAQMQASKKNAEFQEQELRNEIAALKEENIRQQKLLGQQTDRRDSAWSVHYVPDVDHSNLQLTPEARIEANLQHEITRLTADNLDLREEVENHDKQVRRLKKQIKILMKRQNMQGGDQSALTPDAGSEPSPKEDEGGPHVKTKDDRVFMGMLEYRKEDEQKLIKNLIIDLKPKSAVNMLPGLPAYILFMCIRHADYIGDDNKVKSLLTGTINGIKRVLKKRNEDFETVSFWLANTCRLLHNLKQYSGEESFANQNNKQQNEHCLRNFDLTEYRQVLSDLAVHIYQMMIKIMESKLQPMIVPGMLEHEAIPGVSGGARPSGMRQRTQSISDEMGGRYTLNSILKQLSVFHSIMTTHGMDPELVKQTFRQTFYIIGAGTLNNLLLRKEMCHWSKGMQIRYNVSQLEEWCRDHHLSDSGAIQSLEPVIQAAQLLQVNKKTEEDAKAICDTCKKLSSQQIIKILNLYTPVNEFEERVSISFIRIIQARLKERKDTQSTLLLDTKFSYPVTFPFNPSSLQLDSIQLPEALNVTFLRKV